MSNAPDSKSAPQMIDNEARIVVQRPVTDVFAFWRGLENFPRFMSHVKEVRAIGNNRHLWRVAGPIGSEFSWESDVTGMVENQTMSWASRPGSSLANKGEVRFRALPTGGTEIHVRLGYAPPAGVVGHAVATLLGTNPAQQMSEDLQRCKELLESGAVGKDGRIVTEGEVRQPVSPASRIG